MQGQNNAPHDYKYISEQIDGSAVTQFVFVCSIRGPQAKDVLLIKRASIILLCQEKEEIWHQKCERRFKGNVLDAILLRRPGQADFISLSFDDGGIQFICYRHERFETEHEIRNLDLLGSNKLRRYGHKLVVDPGGRALCVLSYEKRLILFRLNERTQRVELTARRKCDLKGYLLCACFLQQQTDGISLVVHSSYSEGCQLSLFHWRQGELLEQIQPCHMPLEPGMELCLFMLPLARRLGSFLHITTSGVSLISEYHLRSGDIHYRRVNFEEAVAPCAVLDLAHKQYLALIACDDRSLHVICLGEDGNLGMQPVEPMAFSVSSIALLQTKSTSSNAWTIFVAGNSEFSAIVDVRLDAANVERFRFTNAVPVADLLIVSNDMSTSTITACGSQGITGHLATHFSALSSFLIHELQVVNSDNNAPKQLYVIPNQGHTFTYILVSLPWFSQLFQCSDSEGLDVFDITEEMQLQSRTATLLFFAFNEHLVQVTASGVYRCGSILSQGRPLLIFSDAESVILATQCDGILAIVIQYENTFKFLVMQLLKSEADDLALTCLVDSKDAPIMRSETTCISSTRWQDSGVVLILLCSADGGLSLFEITLSSCKVVLETHLEVCRDRRASQGLLSEVPHSCKLFYTNDRLRVIIGLSSGKLAHCSVHGPQVDWIELIQAGYLPLNFCPGDVSDNSCYIMGSFMARLTILEGRIRLEKIAMPGCSSLQAVISGFNPFSDLRSPTLERGVLFIRDGCLSFTSIGTQIQKMTTLVDLSETPRRLLYLEKLGAIVVATTRSSGSRSHHVNLKMVKSGTIISENPMRDTKTQSPLFRPDDVIYCLAQWDVTINHVQKSWTIIGTSRKNTKSARADMDVLEGRLIVLRFKMVNGKLDVRKEFSPSFANPIYALCPLGPLSLVIAHGSVIEVSTLDIASRSLGSRASTTLRSTTVALHTHGNYIFAATQKDSITVLRYYSEANKLVRVASDPCPRLSLSMVAHYDLALTLILTEKNKKVSVYHWDDEKQQLITQCTLNMPSVIVKTRVLPISNDYITQHSSTLDLKPYVILAAGLDGSLHTIIRVSSSCYRVIDDHRQLDTERFWDDKMLADYIDLLNEDQLSKMFEGRHRPNSMTETKAQLHSIFVSYGRQALAL